jgi:hypothetical protein
MAFMPKGYRPPVPPLNPMSTFDPDKSALVYDQLNDNFIMWVPAEFAALFRQHGLPLDDEGSIGWDGFILTGWLGPDARNDPAVCSRLEVWGEVIPFPGSKRKPEKA